MPAAFAYLKAALPEVNHEALGAQQRAVAGQTSSLSAADSVAVAYHNALLAILTTAPGKAQLYSNAS